jgi:predicted ribosomally synthesized peptide with nif11-like leader
MSEEQLSALLAKLKEDAGLREKLQGAGDLDSAVTLAKEAGFDVRKADWLKYQAKQTLELSDEELEGAAGGARVTIEITCNCPASIPCDAYTQPQSHCCGW